VRHAILSDVHANATALKAVLTDAQDFGVSYVYCLGDVLGYGPDPVAALELVHDRAHVCLLGNHDAAVCGSFPVGDFTPVAAKAVEAHRSRLSAKALAWLKTLPIACEGPGFACTHGDFSEPEAFNYILEPEDAMPSWQVRDEQLLFVGHTHKPGVFVLGVSGEPHCLEPTDFVLEEGRRYIVNVGSVGYPRSGVCRSCYCIYDDVANTVFFRSLPFDLDGYRRKMNGMGIDEAPWIAARAKDRLRPSVRAAADFSKKGHAQHGEAATAKNVAAVSPKPDAPETAQRPGGLGPALVIGAMMLGLAGVFCTYRLIRAMPDPAQKAAVEAVDVASVPTSSSESYAPAFDMDHPVVLSGGWTAYVEVPSRQKVRVVANTKENTVAFRIENEGEAWVRFVRTRSLFDKPESIHTMVKVLTRPLPGRKSDFAFATSLSFFGEGGRPIGVPTPGWGKNSSRRKTPVPDGAVSAEFRIDCRAAGVHEIAVPYFSPDSPRIQTNKKRRDENVTTRRDT